MAILDQLISVVFVFRVFFFFSIFLLCDTRSSKLRPRKPFLFFSFLIFDMYSIPTRLGVHCVRDHVTLKRE